MFTPADSDLERGWPGRIDGDMVVQLAAQTLQSFFTGGSSAREHAAYPLAEVMLRAPVLEPPAVRVFDRHELLVREPDRNPLTGREITRPDGRLDVALRLAPVIGANGSIGGWTGLAEWRATELAAPKDRDFALLLGPVVETELADDFDWEAARAARGANTRLRPGDLLGGPVLALHEDVESGASSSRSTGSARSPRSSLDSPPGAGCKLRAMEDLIPIGQFARASRLSLKALRLYDENGLLPPARVEPGLRLPLLPARAAARRDADRAAAERWDAARRDPPRTRRSRPVRIDEYEAALADELEERRGSSTTSAAI